MTEIALDFLRFVKKYKNNVDIDCHEFILTIDLNSVQDFLNFTNSYGIDHEFDYVRVYSNCMEIDFTDFIYTVIGIETDEFKELFKIMVG